MVEAAVSPPAATSQSCTLWSEFVVITTLSDTGLNSTYLRAVYSGQKHRRHQNQHNKGKQGDTWK